MCFIHLIFNFRVILGCYRVGKYYFFQGLCCVLKVFSNKNELKIEFLRSKNLDPVFR